MQDKRGEGNMIVEIMRRNKKKANPTTTAWQHLVREMLTGPKTEEEGFNPGTSNEIWMYFSFRIHFLHLSRYVI